jgi:hypothetical protein
MALADASDDFLDELLGEIATICCVLDGFWMRRLVAICYDALLRQPG